MLTKIKKRAAVVMAAAVCLTSVSASAAQWQIKDYDTTNAMAGVKPVVPIVYQEFDDNGYPTGRVTSGYDAQEFGLKGFADAELKGAWVSDVYPNKEYTNLYADGVYTGKVFATGRDGADLVEYKDVDFMWEVAAPHKIFSIKKAKLNIDGKAQWFGTVEKGYPVEYTGRNATVLAERVKCGFGDYEILGDNVVAKLPAVISGKYKAPAVDGAIAGITAADLNPNVGFAKKIDVTKVYKNIFVPRSYGVALAGPLFDDEGNVSGTLVVNGVHYDKPADMNIPDIVGVCTDSLNGGIEGAEITWTPAGFEAEAPYRLYEYLTIDGVVMDGRMIGVNEYMPAIYRYTSATANLKFRTIVKEVNANGEVVLNKQVSYDDGVTFVTESTINTGIYPNAEYRVELATVIDGVKTLTPVYKFNYNGENYSTYEINGEWFTEKWGNFGYSANVPSAPIAPYVVK